jgi:hypothetical protein
MEEWKEEMQEDWKEGRKNRMRQTEIIDKIWRCKTGNIKIRKK